MGQELACELSGSSAEFRVPHKCTVTVLAQAWVSLMAQLERDPVPSSTGGRIRCLKDGWPESTHGAAGWRTEPPTAPFHAGRSDLQLAYLMSQEKSL